MILKRKIFASTAALRHNPGQVIKYQSSGVLIELIKSIEFYDKEFNMRHWLLDEIVGKYFSETLKAKGDYKITDTLARGEKYLPKRFSTGKNISSGPKFIRETLELFKPGKEPYKKYEGTYKEELSMMNINDLVSFYQRVLRYLALSFTGQINPDLVGFWDREVDLLVVDYESQDPLTRDLKAAKKVLLKCIINVKGYETPEIRKLLWQ